MRGITGSRTLGYGLERGVLCPTCRAGPRTLGWPCHSWSNRARACRSSLTVMVCSAAGCRLGPLGLAAWGGWGAAVGLVHAHGDDHAGGGREGRDRSDGGG